MIFFSKWYGGKVFLMVEDGCTFCITGVTGILNDLSFIWILFICGCILCLELCCCISMQTYSLGFWGSVISGWYVCIIECINVLTSFTW